MNKLQLFKILKVMIIATFLMFAFELLFSFDIVTNWLKDIVLSLEDNMFLLYFAIWIIMFLQTTIVPIPAYIVLNAAVNVGIVNSALGLSVFATGSCWIFIAVVLSSYIVGAAAAYFIGYKWGAKAVKWCAGDIDEYKKWSCVINEKGKWWYAATVILPVFPDDLLCIVAGSIKFNFKFFLFSNILGRGIGLIFMIGTLVLFQKMNEVGGLPITVICWGAALIVLLIAYYILKVKLKKSRKEK